MFLSCVYSVYTTLATSAVSMSSLGPSLPSLPALNLRPSSLFKALILLGVLIFVISYSYWSRLVILPTNVIHRKPLPSENFQFDNPTGQNWTHRIWQTSRNPVVSITEEDREHVKTWSDLNPEYRHEVLTDEMMEDYVKDHFHFSHPDIEEIYFEIKDYILRSDLIRYLILLADGGVYNDLDVGCEKPIKSWVPPQFQDTAGILLGVEVDNKFGPDGRTFENGQDLFQLVNWTIMSKPNQPFMWFLVMRVIDNIKRLAASQKQKISEMEYSIQNVLEVTGPAALTKAFFDYASDITSSNVTYRNFTKMTKPRLIGEVVILPIQAFGAGHQVQWAGWEPDGSELIHHYFAGSWKTDHHDSVSSPLSVDQKADGEDQDGNETEDKEHQVEDEGDGQNVAVDQGKTNEVIGETNRLDTEQFETSQDQVEGESSTDVKDSTEEPDMDNVQPADLSDATLNDSGAIAGDSASDKPAPVQFVEDHAGKESMMNKIEKAKAEMAKATEDADAQKTKEEEAKKKALEEEEAGKRKAAEAKAKAQQKGKEIMESHMTKEEKEEEERKQKWEEVKAAAPKEARPKTEEEKHKVSNNLADYDYQFD